MIIWEIIGFIVLIVIISLFASAYKVISEADELCKGFEQNDASIWNNKVICYNEKLINKTYTKVNITHKIRT